MGPSLPTNKILCALYSSQHDLMIYKKIKERVIRRMSHVKMAIDTWDHLFHSSASLCYIQLYIQALYHQQTLTNKFPSFKSECLECQDLEAADNAQLDFLAPLV